MKCREFFIVEQWMDYEGSSKDYFFDYQKALAEYNRRTTTNLIGVKISKVSEIEEGILTEDIKIKKNGRSIM